MPSFIDLHTHTTASDGAMTPSELVRYAEECGLSAIAVTDHDSVDGLEEATIASQGLNIEVIEGIELSADYEREMHILGLYIDPYAAILQGAMHELTKWRAQRNEQMIENLAKMGLDITRDDVLSQRADGNMAEIGRVHIALALMQKGYAATANEAFDRYLSKEGGAYVSRRRFSPQRCIEIIKSAGGYAFLAHPLYSQSEPQALDTLVCELVEYGLNGLECYHSAHTYEFCEQCVSICRKYDLMISGGSDFHGANKPNVKLGQVCDGKYIEFDLLIDIKRKLGLE